MRKILILPILISFFIPISVFGRPTTVDNNLQALEEWDNGPIKANPRMISPGEKYFGSKNTGRPVFAVYTDIRALLSEGLPHLRRTTSVERLIFRLGEDSLPGFPTVAVVSSNSELLGDGSVGFDIASPTTNWDKIFFCPMGWLKDAGIVPPKKDIDWEDYPLTLCADQQPDYAVPAPGAIVLGALGTALVGWGTRRRFQF